MTLSFERSGDSDSYYSTASHPLYTLAGTLTPSYLLLLPHLPAKQWLHQRGIEIVTEIAHRDAGSQLSVITESSLASLRRA